MAKDTLIDSLDEAASNLLERSKNDANLTVGEMVRVFESMSKWAELRVRLVPPKKEVSKFDIIKGQFNGTKGKPDRASRSRGVGAETDETAEVSTGDT